MINQLAKKGIFILLFSLFLTAFIIWAILLKESQANLLVAFLNVGQGDAIFIEAPNGNQILIDGGPDKKVVTELGKIMPFFDKSLDAIIETHPDSDHIAGLIEVLKRYKVGLVIEPGLDSDNPVYQTLNKMIKEKKIKKIFGQRGMRLILDKKVFLNILFPDRKIPKVEDNTGSIVAKLIYGKISFLLTGDSPKNVEKYLVLLEGRNLKSNVLKVSHHGSATATSDLFLNYVNPDYAVISVGKNKFGHPHKEVLERLKRFKIKILRTDEKGTIKFYSDGQELKLSEK